MKDETLRPCEECGGDAIVKGRAASAWWAHCVGFGCTASTEEFPTREQAIAAWNKRPSGNVESLVEALELIASRNRAWAKEARAALAAYRGS